MAPLSTTPTDRLIPRRQRASVIRLLAPFLLALTVSGCDSLNTVSERVLGRTKVPEGQPGHVTGFLGAIVADEPRAVLAGKEVLSAGGNAADAAVATALSLSVTLPSRAGLGGGGVCLAYTANRGAPEAIMFVPPAATSLGDGDRPAAVPMTARGLFLLHTRHGHLPFESLISKAEQLARSGVPVSRALARDLALVYGPLSADPGARGVFGSRDGALTEGQGLIQPALASTLAQLRAQGVGDMYQGQIAHKIDAVSPASGVPIGLADLRRSLPGVATPVFLQFGADVTAFPPTEGGVGAAAAFKVLSAQPDAYQTAFNRALAAAARWRQGGADSDQVLNSDPPAPATVPLYPASTSFATLDPSGNAVICEMTLNNLFGTGRMVAGTGFLAAASPATVTPPLLAAGLAWNVRSQAFRAAVGASGQAGAPLAAASALVTTLRTRQTMPSVVPDPGRANVIACADYLPGSEQACTAAADPRQSGLAAVGR